MLLTRMEKLHIFKIFARKTNFLFQIFIMESFIPERKFHNENTTSKMVYSNINMKLNYLHYLLLFSAINFC